MDKSQFTWAINSKRHQGTYKVVPKVDWMVLLEREFGHPNWAVMYPLNAKGQPVGLLTPRLACKLFYDGVYVIKRGEDNPKFVQDHIPEIAHKCFKKKQWRKQYFEGMRRVCCRLALGKGFQPNCVAEDVFVYALISMAHEMGWRRIESLVEHLPVSEFDKDYNKVLRLAANDEVGAMIKTVTDVVAEAPSTAAKKKSASNAAIANAKLDVRSWFNCYDVSEDHLFDHIVFIGDKEPHEELEEEFEIWSFNTGTTASASTIAPTTSSSSSTICSSTITPLSGDSKAAGAGAGGGGGRVHSSFSLSASHSMDRAEKLYPGVGVPGRFLKMTLSHQQQQEQGVHNREKSHLSTGVGGDDDEVDLTPEPPGEGLTSEKNHI